MQRRTFLLGALGSAAPAALTAGVGTAAAGGPRLGQGLHLRATTAPGLGIQRVIWSGPTDTDAVALTFDDGPDPELTPQVLDVLDRYGVPATFLLVGSRVVERPDLVDRAIEAGHELGNHTWSHHSLATLEPDEVRRELQRTAEVLPPSTMFFRPPRGVLTGAATQAAGELGYDLLMWSCSRGPAAETDPAAVSRSIARRTGPGTIICLHDGVGRSEMGRRWGKGAGAIRKKRRVELAALPAVIEHGLDAGLRFATASELVPRLSGDA